MLCYNFLLFFIVFYLDKVEYFYIKSSIFTFIFGCNVWVTMLADSYCDILSFCIFMSAHSNHIFKVFVKVDRCSLFISGIYTYLYLSIIRVTMSRMWAR